MQQNTKYSIALLFSLITYIGLIYLNISGIAAKNNGTFTYPIDDTYIHMSIAKNLSENGTWGINAGEYASTTSSPLWTLLIAFVYYLTGVNVYIPLILGIFSGILLLIISGSLLSNAKVSPLFNCMVLIVIILAGPLPLLAISGMEHLLHTCVFLLLLFVGAKWIIRQTSTVSQNVSILLLSGISVCLRLESLFVIIPCVFYLALAKNYSKTIILTLGSIIPLLINGIISLMHGWYLLPNSILLKTLDNSTQGFTSKLSYLYAQHIDNDGSIVYLALIFIIAAVLIMYMQKKNVLSKVTRIEGTLLLGTLFLHLLFGRFGWIFRYEAYLVISSIIMLTILVNSFFSHHKVTTVIPALTAITVFILLSGYSLFPRIAFGVKEISNSTHTIYLQHFQLADFFRQYYPQTVIGIQDIGAVGYYGNSTIVDLWGLADKRIARWRINNSYSADKIEQYALEKDIRAIAIYANWFEKGLFGWATAYGIPSSWIKVTTWTIPETYVTGGKTVTFFAINEDYAHILSKRLTEFRDQLPKEVASSSYYK